MFECLASYGVRPPLLITLTYDDLSHTMHESGNTTTVFKQFSAKTNCAIISLPFVHNHNIESKTNNVEKKTWKSERNRRNSLIKTRYLHAYIHTYISEIHKYFYLFYFEAQKDMQWGDIEEILWGNTHTYRKLKVGWVFPQKSGWWREVAIIFVEGGWFMSIAILLRYLKGKPKRGKMLFMHFDCFDVQLFFCFEVDRLARQNRCVRHLKFRLSGSMFAIAATQSLLFVVGK